jgi:hypothetical protein
MYEFRETLETSFFLSDESGRKTATVYKHIINGSYNVVVKSDTGSTFTASFDNREEAENFAEDWVLK